ncbi:MAG TPA: glycosyltransferase family 87 protein [Chloroflexota bacterium]
MLEWLVAALAAALLAYQLASPDARIGDDDFQVFYTGAAAIAAGHSPYIGDFVSPPWFALALVPLTWLPLAAARGVWLALGLALLLGTTAGCARLVGLEWPARRLVLAALVFGLWPPVEFGLKLGQNSLLVWALIVAALLAAQAHRYAFTGALIGLALVKPQLVVLFAAGLAVRAAPQRAISRYLGAAATVVAALALAVWLVAPDAYADLLALRPHTWEYWGSTVALPPLLAQVSGSQTFGIAAYLLVAIVGGLAVLREWARDCQRSIAPVAALTAAASLVLAPYTYPHDAVLLQLPILWLVPWVHALPRSAWRTWLAVGVCALCGLWLLERPADYTPWRFLGLLPPLGLLLALVFARRALSYSTTAAPRHS